MALLALLGVLVACAVIFVLAGSISALHTRCERCERELGELDEEVKHVRALIANRNGGQRRAHIFNDGS